VGTSDKKQKKIVTKITNAQTKIFDCSTRLQIVNWCKKRPFRIFAYDEGYYKVTLSRTIGIT